MRVALAQVNPTVGDVAGNTRLAIEAIEAAQSRGADLIILPELCLLGYPPRDLLLREGVLESCEMAAEFVAATTRHSNHIVLLGYPRKADDGRKPAHNSIAVCRGGVIERIYDKRLFPGYDVFDEDRYFEPGQADCVFEVRDQRVGILVCEDLWQAKDVAGADQLVPRERTDPVLTTVEHRIDLLVVPSASPFVIGKGTRHVDHLSKLAREHGITVAMVNQTGANDDLIFDGRSMAIAPSGEVMAFANAFAPDVCVVDLPRAAPIDVPAQHPIGEMWHALVLGVRDYVRKTGNREAIIGLSGGIDSALTATIAAAALGPENVIGVMMPSRYSSEGSITDSEALSKNLGLGKLERVSIEHAHAAFQTTLGSLESGVADENVQARLRGIILMAFSNAHAGSLVLATGNKSEMSTGYCTLYGDMCGALAVLGDVLKTQVYELSEWINDHHAACGFAIPPIPQSTLDKPPSAELKPNQTDQDTLPPYHVLDELIRRYVDFEQSVERICRETGFGCELVRKWTRVIDINEYKRLQAAIVLKVNPRTFGPGRPMPAAMKVDLRPHADAD